MKKLPNILFFLCILFVSVNFTQELPPAKDSTDEEIVETDSFNEENLNEDEDETIVCQLPPDVIALELSHKEISLACPALNESCSYKRVIEVKIAAADTGDNKYVYTVSAGKIIGEGANVEWDLSDVNPGTYTITAGISIPVWGVVGQTRTKVVIIKEY